MNRMLVRAGLVVVLSACAMTSFAQEGVKVVYHLSEGVQQASRAIGNIRNQLNAEAKTKIVVVTHGPGIDFLLAGAQDSQGRDFAGPIGELAGKGVEFRVCNNTLTARQIPKDKVVLEANVVPSGVVEVSRLQAKDGFVYLRP